MQINKRKKLIKK